MEREKNREKTEKTARMQERREVMKEEREEERKNAERGGREKTQTLKMVIISRTMSHSWPTMSQL